MSASGQPVGGLYVTLRGDTGDFDRDMQRSRREMDRTEERGQSLTDQVRALEGAFLVAGAAAAGLVVSLGLMTRRFGSVDQQFSRIQEVSQATAEQMERMREEALQIGVEMPTTMKDSADTLYELQTAGLSAEQATDALAGTTYLAVAGQLQMAEAAQATVSVLNAWQLEASKAAAVADMLASTSSASATEINEMADAFRYANSTAAQVGVSSDELSAFVGLLSDVGMEASIAGTSINNALLSLVNPTQRAEDALGRAGIAMEEFYTESGELKDMTDILALLNDRLSDLSEVERQEILSDVFGIRGARAIAPAIDQVERYNELLAESARAQVAGGVDRLGELSDEELSQRQQDVGFNLQPGSTRDVLEQFREQAQSEGWSEEELATQIEVGLDISPEAAELLAGDLAGGTDMGQLVSGIESATTSSELASASMEEFRGQVEELTGSLDTFFYRVYRGAVGPMSMLVSGLIPVGEFLAENEGLAHTLGIALVGLAGAATVAAGALGIMVAEAIVAETALVSAITATTTYSYVTAALSPSQLAAAASSFTLSGALATVSGALSTAAGAALSFWAAIGPIGWVILGLIGLFAAWKTGLLDFIGLGSEADAVVESIMWVLGGLADALGIAGGELGGVVGWLLEFLGVALKVQTLPLVITIKALGVALRYLGDAVEVALTPFESLWNIMTGTADAADWLNVALLAIPGVGIAVWALDAAGALDTLTSPLDTAAQAGDDLAGVLGGLVDVGTALLSPFESIQNIMDGTASSADWLNVALLAIPGGGLIAWALNAAGALDTLTSPLDTATEAVDWLTDGIDGLADVTLDPIVGALEGVGDTLEWLGEMAQWALDMLNKVPFVGALVPDSKGSPDQPGGQNGGGSNSSGGSSGGGDDSGGGGPLGPGGPASSITTSSDQTAAATGSEPTTSSGEGSGSMEIAHSPTFNVDLGLDSIADLGNLDDQIGEMTDQAIDDLKREIETQFFRFETGQ